MTYFASAQWDGHNWVATLDGYPGAVTQAPEFDQLPAQLAEVVRLASGEQVTEDQVEVRSLSDDPRVTGVLERLDLIEDVLDLLAHPHTRSPDDEPVADVVDRWEQHRGRWT